jgi:hypothetical protein
MRFVLTESSALQVRCDVRKSLIVAQVAEDLDYRFLDVRAVQLDPVDLRGLPRIAADQTEWVPPKFLPTTGKGILFLDELTSAPQMHESNMASICAWHNRLQSPSARPAQGFRSSDGSSPDECKPAISYTPEVKSE